MTTWPTAVLALWHHFGQAGFTAAAAVQAARQDPTLDDRLMALAGSADANAVERALHAHVGQVAHGLRLREWPAPTGTLVFTFAPAESGTSGPVRWT